MFLLGLLALAACGGNTDTASTTGQNELVDPGTVAESKQTAQGDAAGLNAGPAELRDTKKAEEQLDIFGYYVGPFEAEDTDDPRYQYANRINISLDSIVGKQLYGHSVVAGNDRPFQGPWELQENYFMAEAKEPGDDKYDGTFFLAINMDTKELSGTWKSYKKLPVSKRSYKLKRKYFNYDPSLDLPESVGWTELYDIYGYDDEGEFLTEEVLMFNASTQQLKKEDIENMYKGDLEIIRNAIYARHGYSFKNRKVRFIFDRHVDWYIPLSTDVRSQLTALEKSNEDLLKRYEDHADRYYDVFGR